jgi:hypothetical protein
VSEKKKDHVPIGILILFGLFFGTIGAFVGGFLLHIVVFIHIGAILGTDLPIAFIISSAVAIIWFFKSLVNAIDER